MEKLKGMLPINWELAGNPVNWVILWLMLTIGGAAIVAVLGPRHSITNQSDED